MIHLRCELCGLKFSDRPVFQEHMALSHSVKSSTPMNLTDEQEKKYKIQQRKPDVSQDESVYSTAILDSKGMPLHIGYGHNPSAADSKALGYLLASELALAREEVVKKIDSIPTNSHCNMHVPCEQCVWLVQENLKTQLQSPEENI